MTSGAHDQTSTKTVLHSSRFQIQSKGHAVWLLGIEGLTAQDLGIGERKLVSSRICVWAIYLPVNVVQSNYGLPFQFYGFYLLALSWQCCQMCSNHFDYDLAKHLIWIVSNVVKSATYVIFMTSKQQIPLFGTPLLEDLLHLTWKMLSFATGVQFLSSNSDWPAFLVFCMQAGLLTPPWSLVDKAIRRALISSGSWC